MTGSKIEPHLISKVVQLPAVWLVALVILAPALGALALTASDLWLQIVFAAAAVVCIPTILAGVFLLQTKFRAELQDDPHYLMHQVLEEKKFANFEPENLVSNKPQSGHPITDASWGELEDRRKEAYEASNGLFLVHSWRPSETPGQVADVVIALKQHNAGPLTDGKVKYVEYHLGNKFFDYPVIKTNADENFALDVSAYYPMLCLARVHFHDARPPLLLTRYCDFDSFSDDIDSGAKRDDL